MQDSKLLRHLDRYVGKACCYAISWTRSALRLGSGQPRESVNKVLMIELFEMGAALMLVPSISYLKRQNPQLEVHCLTTHTCLPVWKAVDALDANNIHVIESGSALRFLWSAFKTLLRLRAIRFDLIIDYELFMRISAIFSGMLRACRRAGFYKYDYEGLERGEFFDARCAYNQNSHISRNYLSLTKTAFEQTGDLPNFKNPLPLDEITIQPAVTRATTEELAQILGDADGSFLPYVVVCPDVGKTLTMRNYPRESFAAVIQELLLRYRQRRVVVIGTAENRETSEAILKQVPLRARCVDLCGKTSFAELLKVISGADLLTTNDNGPEHFATLTGTKTLALFSTDSPFVYGPLGDAVIAYSFYQCSPCISAYNHKTSRCNDNRCLKALAPRDVIELACQILEGKATFRTINNRIPYLF